MLRAVSRSEGRNSARSTPLRSTRTRSAAMPSSTSRCFSPLETATNPSALSRRPADPAARDRVLGDDIEIAASGGDDDRATEGAPEQHGSDAVRIKIVGIDQIEVVTVAKLPAQKRQYRGAKRERRGAHPDPGEYGIARMIDLQPVAGLLAWDPGKHGIPAEPRGRERKPWTGRQNTGADNAALNKFPQTRLDENPVLGLQQARI